MTSIQKEFVAQLIESGASQRDIAYATANIPKEFWDISRDSIEITPNNKAAVDYVISYVDDLHNSIANGSGLTLLGEPKSGKTLLGCAILKSAAINPFTLLRDYSVLRVNYDVILEDLEHLRNDEAYAELKNALIKASILFVDSISLSYPNTSILSILRTRRDFRRPTILAYTVSSMTNLPKERAYDLLSIFSDVNKQYYLRKR